MSEIASFYRLQVRVAAMLQGGASLARVETEVIEPSELAAEHKAALSLYATAVVQGREQRARGASSRRSRPGWAQGILLSSVPH